MADRVFRPETLAIHAGQIPDVATGARALPIYQTTSFVFDSADHAASLFNLATFGNPSLAVVDIAAVADVAHAHGLPLIIDNTVPSPFLCNPLALGADIVVHSATKYLGGHGTTLGGVMVEQGRFPWDNGKFPAMNSPSARYHGANF